MADNNFSGADARAFGHAAGFGGLGAGLMGLFGGSNNPYDSASEYYKQIPGAVSPYLNPYINAGRGAMGQLQDQYGKMVGNYGGVQDKYNQLMNDPNAFLAKIGAGYQKSPGFDWQMNQGMNAANNAAAAGGMAGSPQHQQQAATMAEGLANQDYYNYMNKALGAFNTGLSGNAGLYGMGIQGLQGLNNQGYNASNNMANMMNDYLSNQGQMAYAGQAYNNQQQGNMWGDIFGGLGALAFL
jgi:hypothetical protein